MNIAYRGFLYEAIESINNKPTLNSKGQPIHDTQEGIVAFWNWFGDSVTVDSEGRPVVYYHGTFDNFAEFQLPFERDDYDPDHDYSEGWSGGNLGHGHYFTDSHVYAKRFGTPKEYYLKILNMYDLSTDDNIEAFNIDFREEVDDLTYGVPGELIELNMKKGKFDGVIGKDVGGFAHGATEVMVPNSNQIKSVVNEGTFDNSGNTLSEGILSVIADVGLKAIGAGEIPGQTSDVLHDPTKKKDKDADKK